MEFILSFLLQLSLLNEAKHLSYSNSPQASNKILQGDFKYFTAEQQFFRSVNYMRLNNKREALKAIENLEFLQNVPERYLIVAGLMKHDLALWKNDDDDLGDIAREMTKVKDRLSNGNASKTTKKIGDDIVARLDKIIKDAEDNKKKQDDQQQQAQQKEIQRVQNPAENPIIGGETGPGNVDNKRIKNLVEKWGSMPPREQARALQDITRGMSVRHREGIENFFRNLAQGTKK